MRQTLDAISESISRGQPYAHMGINAANTILAVRDPEYRSWLQDADIVTADGQSVVWAARLLRLPIPERVTGIDLMSKLLDYASALGWRVYFYGGSPEVVRVVAMTAERRGVTVSGYCDGYRGHQHWKRDVNAIAHVHTDLLFVGMPSPAKERFIAEHAKRSGILTSVGVGGSFDVIAGRVRRAPLFVQSIGMEWAYRLVQEPRRLMRRYLVTNVLFALLVVRERLGRRSGPRTWR